jgi:hypothetical protein
MDLFFDGDSGSGLQTVCGAKASGPLTITYDNAG